jgi:hypothetical protein
VEIAEIIELAVRSGAVPDDAIRGLTRDEVEKVRGTNARGQALPAAYEEFLLRAGRSFGGIGARFQMCYPDVLEIYPDAHDCAASALALLDETDLLFGQNFGVNWYWLRGGEPDPAVMCYSEIDRSLRPVLVEPSFTKWLETVVHVSQPPG